MAGYEVIVIGPHNQKEVVSGIQVIPIVGCSDRLGRIFKVARTVVQRAVLENGDLYHLHDPELLLWANLLNRTGAPVVFDMHEDLPLQVRGKVWIPKFFRPLISNLVKMFERNFIHNRPVVMAEKSYSSSRPWLNSWVEVLNFPKLDWLAHLQQESPIPSIPRVGYIGAVTKGRGSFRMIEALGELKRNGLSLQFDCIGSITPSHRDSLLELVKRNDLDNVFLPGFMRPEEGWARIAGCQVGLAVLQPLPNYLESYPTKMFEYMAMGIPVIVSNFPLYRQIVDKYNCGVVVDPLDTGAVSRAIAFLVENPKVASEMGKRGQIAALNNFNWKSEEVKLLEFYEKILSKNDFRS